MQAIVDSYKSFLDETYGGMSDDTMGLIGEARELLQNDLQQQEDAYSEFRQQSPLVTRGTDEINPLQDRLTASALSLDQAGAPAGEWLRQTPARGLYTADVARGSALQSLSGARDAA